MDEPGPLVDGHVVGGHDDTGVAALDRQVVEGPVVAQSDERVTRDRAEHLCPLAEDCLDELLGDDGAVDHRVGQRGVDRDAHVAEEGPGRGRPDEQRRRSRGGRDGPVFEGEPHERGEVGLDGVHVGLAELVARQRRLAPWAVRQHLEVLVQQPRVEDRL